VPPAPRSVGGRAAKRVLKLYRSIYHKLRGVTREGGLFSGEKYPCHHTVEALKTQADRGLRATPTSRYRSLVPDITLRVYFPTAPGLPGVFFLGACSNIYGSDSYLRIFDAYAT